MLERYELQEVSEEALRAARDREHSFWLGLKDAQLAESNRELAESNQRLAEAITRAATLGEIEPDVLVQAASSQDSRFLAPTDRRQSRGRSHTGFRHTKSAKLFFAVLGFGRVAFEHMLNHAGREFVLAKKNFTGLLFFQEHGFVLAVRTQNGLYAPG